MEQHRSIKWSLAFTELSEMCIKVCEAREENGIGQDCLSFWLKYHYVPGAMLT